MSTTNTRRSQTAVRYGSLLAPLTLASFFIVTAIYKQINFGNSQIDELLFYFQNGLADGQSSDIITALISNIPWILLLAGLLSIPLRWITRYRWHYTVVTLLISIICFLTSFGVPAYLKALTESSELYERFYIDPRSADLRFPENKRNLVHIYVESLENTVGSDTHGGQAPQSLIPELEELALNEQNVSFSHTDAGLGGAPNTHGTSWTVGGMVAQSGGVPLKTSLLGKDHNSYGYYKQFLPGAYTLGDILHKHGYQQSFIMGSGASFGGRDKLLQQHGNYHIIDHNYAKNTGMLPKDYLVWWGYEDKKLFEYAKKEALRLGAQSKPFNLQLLTADTHFTNGYLDTDCPTPYTNKYDNVHSCSSRRIAAFVKWVKGQPFGNNTTIIITGDHLGMQTPYYDEKMHTPNYQRTTYNVFINPAVRPTHTHKRIFTPFDIYPSTLAAMGVSIVGEKLALGTNLFSQKQTLAEQLGGIAALNTELAKRSSFYENNIMIQK